MSAKKPEIIAVKPADENNQVVTIKGGGGAYRRKVCAECPWRKDKAGSFPAEAFRHSANTAHDMSSHTFACHMHGAEHPVTCAGFLLEGADNNLSVRLSIMSGKLDPTTITTDAELHRGYRAMAIANGVPPEDPAIADCRD